MCWMIHSTANGKSWIGPINIYIEIEEILTKYNLNLLYIDCYDGNFFEWLIITDDYCEEMLDAIEMALSDERLDVVIEDHLLIMREVFKDGNVIMG